LYQDQIHTESEQKNNMLAYMCVCVCVCVIQVNNTNKDDDILFLLCFYCVYWSL